MQFGGGVAGRAHTARGDALRAGVGPAGGRAGAVVTGSAVEIAAALRAGADRYAEAELYARRIA